MDRRERQHLLPRAAWMMLLALGVPVAGCHRAKPAPQDAEDRAGMQDALNRMYAASPACLWAKPVTLEHTRGGPDAMSAKEARALDEAGVLDKARHGYTLTDAGRPFWKPDASRRDTGNVCFGHWHVSRVTGVTPQKDDPFGATVQATFEASIPSPALWTRVPEVQAAFPLMAAKLNGLMPHSATMQRTSKGWRVAVIAAP